MKTRSKPLSTKRSRRPDLCRGERAYLVCQTLRGVKYARVVCGCPRRHTLENLGRGWMEGDDRRAPFGRTDPERNFLNGISQGEIAFARERWGCPESREDRKLRLAREQMAEIRKQQALEEKIRGTR